ncbi:MAG TPA: RNA-binding domain-containing protein, partial [Steroidobacteraceae bacterium]|nr:RNA-binding domain-containing protein [Steroidobacteraceae bacterium]
MLSSAFTKAVNWNLLSHNVCNVVARHPEKPRDRYVTTEEFDRVKGLLSTHSLRESVGLAMDLALETGMSQGEIIELRWADIRGDTLSVSGETIPLRSKVQAILNECRALSPDSEYVITTRKGTPYTSEGFRACWQKLMNRAMKGRAAYKRRTKKPVAAAPPVLTERFTFQDLHATWSRNREIAGGSGEVRELISRRRETPRVELKQWMPLSETLVRAKLARHLAALCNYGGGYLIFGFCDDGTADPAQPGDLSEFTSDKIASIVDKYLTPAFHCEVSTVQLPDGEVCVVVKVPPHGSVPVCTKAAGPHDPKGNPQGVDKGRYYTRVNGPKSEPIETPEQWAPIIRRCVLNERHDLLNGIAALLKAPPAPAEDPPLTPTPKREPQA